jgi:predicted small metal-binding protein
VYTTAVVTSGEKQADVEHRKKDHVQKKHNMDEEGAAMLSLLFFISL